MVADGEAVFVFDCPFDAALDEYPADYHVYRLPPGAVIPESGSWERLPGLGTLLGRVPVDRVRFDPTLRAAIDPSILDSFGR